MVVTQVMSSGAVATGHQLTGRQKIAMSPDLFKTESAGFKWDDVLTSKLFREPGLRPVKVEDLIDQGADLFEDSFKDKSPISFTFKTAVKFVIDLINRSPYNGSEGTVQLALSSSGKMSSDIHMAITNIETPNPGLLSDPPNYYYQRCSSSRDSFQFLEAVILHMLYRANIITGYGQKGPTFWVELPRTT